MPKLRRVSPASARDQRPVFFTGGLLSAGGGVGVGEPRNNMSRLNGRVHHTGPQHATSAQYQAVPQYHQGAPVQYQGSQGHPEEFEPSCLVRTPSGNVYIPSDMPKTSTLEYKAGLHSPSLHSPVKRDPQKAMEGYNVPFGGGLPAPVLPVRNNLRRPGPGRVGGSSSSAGRGGQGSPHCSWRCTAIIFITIAVVLGAILIYIAGELQDDGGNCKVTETCRFWKFALIVSTELLK
ncbi:uncharacterized protein LOC119582900 isoform X1 [Penaeus monodon]|uniref:uncharacterized protein LOC119582900 isoform X1 n=1 Tax=Penaeus monodon TaxID=6687 RepID=UPI0018A6F34D|nr:uncharacterized protein LOC119582900 isoform X1 [Penaeus monodon]